MKKQYNSTGLMAIAGLAALAFATATPALAHGSNDRTISVNGMTFGDGDILEQLIALDAADIDELRIDMAEARAEVLAAINEIEEAREEVEAAPGGGMILRIAFGAASTAVTESTDEVFAEVRAGLHEAEIELANSKDEIGPEEFAQTQEAINVIRDGLAAIESAIDELVNALKA